MFVDDVTFCLWIHVIILTSKSNRLLISTPPFTISFVLVTSESILLQEITSSIHRLNSAQDSLFSQVGVIIIALASYIDNLSRPHLPEKYLKNSSCLLIDGWSLSMVLSADHKSLKMLKTISSF